MSKIKYNIDEIIRNKTLASREINEIRFIIDKLIILI